MPLFTIRRKLESNLVFVSYSRNDAGWAKAIMAELAGSNIQCWIDQDNISPGDEWPASIIAGIDASKVMIVILSSHSIQSKYVQREVSHAISQGLIVIPCRVDDTELQGSMKFALANTQSLDVFRRPVNEKIRKLVDAVRFSLGQPAPENKSRVRPWLRLVKMSALAVVAISLVGAAIYEVPHLFGFGANPSLDYLGVTYEIRDRGWSGENLEFTFVATNHSPSKSIQFGRCAIWDDLANNSHEARLILEGRQLEPSYTALELPHETKTSFGLSFKGVSPKAQSITRLRIGFSSQEPLDFTNISIGGRRATASH